MNNPILKEETQTDAASVRERLAREARRRRRLERDRARQLRDGEDAPALTPADLKALKAADAVEAGAVKGQRGAPSIRAKASRMRTAVGDALIARADARRAEMRLAQTVELDAAREEEPKELVLETARGVRQKRLRTRDGLKLAHERGTLTPRDGRSPLGARIEAARLLSLGLRYRDRYEVAQASLRSCLAIGDNVPPSPNMFVQGKAAQRRAALANQVRVLDVAVATRLGPEALLVLRMVAGEARTVRSLTASSRRREALGALLPLALAAVGDILSGAS